MNEIEAYIRQSAAQHGIDPDVAVRVAMSEGGLHDPVRQSDYRKGSTREPSYGPFQLLIGGPGTGYGGGLGNRALAAGIDPRDPNQWQQAVDFALAEAGKRGWGQWYGAARTGIGNYQGIGEHTGGPAPAVQPVASAVQHPPNPTVGTGGYTAPTANTTPVQPPTAVAQEGGQPWAKAISGPGDAASDMFKAPVVGQGGKIPQLPALAAAPLPAIPMIEESVVDQNRRNQLAALMQKYWIS
jgi:hypothetical protein